MPYKQARFIHTDTGDLPELTFINSIPIKLTKDLLKSIADDYGTTKDKLELVLINNIQYVKLEEVFLGTIKYSFDYYGDDFINNQITCHIDFTPNPSLAANPPKND